MRLRQPLAHKSLQLCYCQHLAAHSGACVFPINVVFVFYLTQKDESVLFFRCVLIRGWHPASRWLPFADSPVGSEMAHSKSLLHSLHLATFAPSGAVSGNVTLLESLEDFISQKSCKVAPEKKSALLQAKCILCNSRCRDRKNILVEVGESWLWMEWVECSFYCNQGFLMHLELFREG